MAISPEIINQSVFMAALFLAMISVPKLLALTVWYAYKVWLFRNLEKVAKSKPLQVINKEGTSEILTKEAEDPKIRLKMTTEAYADFTKYIRDPLIEAFSAVSILFFLIPLFPAITTWLLIALIMILAIVIAAIALAVVLWRDVNKMLRRDSQLLSRDSQ